MYVDPINIIIMNNILNIFMIHDCTNDNTTDLKIACNICNQHRGWQHFSFVCRLRISQAEIILRLILSVAESIYCILHHRIFYIYNDFIFSNVVFMCYNRIRFYLFRKEYNTQLKPFSIYFNCDLAFFLSRFSKFTKITKVDI